MTNEELFTDLKQFVAATVSQATADLATKEGLGDLRKEIKADITRLEQRFDAVDRRFDDIDEQLNEIQSAVGAELDSTNGKLDDHERRLYRLEHRSA